jgi:hypothetical protein
VEITIQGMWGDRTSLPLLKAISSNSSLGLPET